MAWWQGETSSRIVRDEAGRIKSVFNYDEQFASFSSEEFKANAANQQVLAKLLKGLPESFTKPLIVAACKSLGATFEDPNFRPELSSILSEDDDIDPSLKYTLTHLTWKRVGELFPGEKRVFDNIEPNDIKQGVLGDCYFLSSLSSLAENPPRIQRMFETAEYDPTGCYKLKMYDMGQPVQVIVDDFFPVNSDGTLAFSGPQEERGITELWVILLEKAWAKRFRSYWNIDAGFTNESLTDLTGAPCDVFNLQPNPQLWKKIFEGDQKGYVITAGSKQSTKGDTVNAQGLVSQHAYAVIAAKEVNTKKGKEQLLMIRNPWGGQEWNGDWSDDSPLWTPELVKELGWAKADDGRFWMNFKDFCKNYEEVVICHVHDDYQLSSLLFTQPSGECTIVQVTLNAPGHFYAVVNQIDGKHFPGQDYNSSPVRMILARIGSNNELEFVKGKLMDIRDSWVDVEGIAGDYLFFFEVLWNSDLANNKVGFSVYCAQSVNLADVTAKHTDFLQRVYTKKLALALPDNPPYKEGRDVTRYNIKRFGLDAEGNVLEGYIAEVFENAGVNQRADVTVMHSKFENVELLPPYAGREYKLSVHSKEIVTVVKKVVDPQEQVEHQVKVSVKLQKT